MQSVSQSANIDVYLYKFTFTINSHSRTLTGIEHVLLTQTFTNNGGYYDTTKHISFHTNQSSHFTTKFSPFQNTNQSVQQTISQHIQQVDCNCHTQVHSHIYLYVQQNHMHAFKICTNHSPRALKKNVTWYQIPAKAIVLVLVQQQKLLYTSHNSCSMCSHMGFLSHQLYTHDHTTPHPCRHQISITSNVHITASQTSHTSDFKRERWALFVSQSQ